MDIILRDASTIARECAEKANSIVEKFALEPDIRLSAHVFDAEKPGDIEQHLRHTSQIAMMNIADALELYNAEAQIRALAGKVNAPVVTGLIAERERYLNPAAKTIEMILKHGGSQTVAKHDTKEVVARLKGIRQRLNTVTTDVVSDTIRVQRLSDADTAQLRDQAAEITHRGRALGAELSRENLDKTITLSEGLMEVLRKHRII